MITSAFGHLIQSKLAKLHWTLPQFAKVLSAGRSEKSLRNLHSICNGEGCGSRGQAQAICKALGITTDECEAALKADKDAWVNLIAEDQRKCFRPHLWIEVTRNWFPSLLPISGPNIYRKVEVPETWAESRSEEEIILRAGEMVASHYLSKDRRVSKEHLVSYLYRREFDLGYRFNPEGGLLEKVTHPVFAPEWRLRIG